MNKLRDALIIVANVGSGEAKRVALEALREYDASLSEADQRDAARYRYLRAHHLQLGPDNWIRTGDDLDEAVDEGMRQSATEER